MTSVAQPGVERRGGTYGEHRSASIHGGQGGWGASPLKLRAFIHTRRLTFIDYMHALHCALELVFTKNCLNSILSNEVLTSVSTDLRNKIPLLLCLHAILIVALNHHYTLVIQ